VNLLIKIKFENLATVLSLFQYLFNGQLQIFHVMNNFYLCVKKIKADVWSI